MIRKPKIVPCFATRSDRIFMQHLYQDAEVLNYSSMTKHAIRAITVLKIEEIFKVILKHKCHTGRT